jgi:hypothetical protein
MSEFIESEGQYWRVELRGKITRDILHRIAIGCKSSGEVEILYKESYPSYHIQAVVPVTAEEAKTLTSL